MSLFARMSNTISNYLIPRKKPNAARAKSPARRSPLRSLSPNSVDKEVATVQPKNVKKRKASSRLEEHATKKRRLSAELEDADLEGTTFISTPKVSQSMKELVSSPKNYADRSLMPPPMKKRSRLAKTPTSPPVKYPRLPWLEADENDIAPHRHVASPGRSIRVISPPTDSESIPLDLHARYAEAMNLPENSGIWAEAERDLFFRLALRGFEPLLPPNWMIDFPTYPLALFSKPNSPTPLLQATSGNDFRAIKALKDLNEMGKRARDRALAPIPLPPEPIISTTVTAYIDWALADAKVHTSHRRGAVPVHAITTLQKGQATRTAITLLTSRLHDLAAAHRRMHNIRPSVERVATPAGGETHVLSVDDDNLPILTGLLICSSLVVVVTLDAHSMPPSPTPVDADDTEDPGLRFIATFDFSDGRMDVWNALAVAIVGMHIRKMMLGQLELAEEAGECEVGGSWEFVPEDSAKDEDPDA